VLATEHFDVLFVTLLPGYPALLGRLLKRRFRVPFVLDYQDPWVGAWGQTVGGGRRGEPDLKSRVARHLGSWLEPCAVRAADAITAVSTGTFEAILERNPAIKHIPCAAIPLGGEAADFEYLRSKAPPNQYFDPHDGTFHLCCVGTLLPLGFETLRAILRATALLRERRPEIYRRFRLHFFGTSNQRDRNALERVIPVAKEIEVDDCVTEVAPRIDYLDALTVLTQANGLLMMGSSEQHYTASKLYPGLHARRPILAVYHEASSVVDILRSAGQPPNIRMVTFDDVDRAESQAEALYCELSAMLCHPEYDAGALHMEAVAEFSAEHLAGKMAEVFNRVVQSDRFAPV
jgi:glycosyltransferase involved in cell wall biosynthesis